MLIFHKIPLIMTLVQIHNYVGLGKVLPLSVGWAKFFVPLAATQLAAELPLYSDEKLWNLQIKR